jgi:hypothetical protein
VKIVTKSTGAMIPAQAARRRCFRVNFPIDLSFSSFISHESYWL